VTVPDSACRALLDETALATALTVPFPVAKLGDPTLSLALRKTVRVAVPEGSVGAGISGTAKVNIAATLKRRSAHGRPARPAGADRPGVVTCGGVRRPRWEVPEMPVFGDGRNSRVYGTPSTSGWEGQEPAPRDSKNA